MYMVFFALFSVVGTWYAWRQNPMYSTGKSLRVLAVILLGIGAMIGIIVAAVNFIQGKSQTVAFTTMGIVIVAATLGMIFLIMAVTTKRDTALPPSTVLVNHFRRNVGKWAKRLGLVCAVLAILTAVLPEPANYVIGSFGGITLLLTVVLLPVMYFTAKKSDHALTALQLNPWIHWVYTPEQWAAWNAAQVSRVSSTRPNFILKRDWRKLLWPYVIVVAAIAVFAPGTPLEKILATLFMTVVVGGGLALVKPDNVVQSTRLRANLATAAPEAWFGPDGLYCDNILTPWLNISNFLMSATVDDRNPRSLLFRFQQTVAGYGNNVIEVDRAILLPQGSEADLALLQQQLVAILPQAQILLH